MTAAESSNSVETVRLAVEPLRRILESAFDSVVARREESRRIVDALIESELCEMPTHGISRIPYYLRGFADTTFDGDAEVHVVHDSRAAVLIDGGGSLGYLPTWVAANLAAERASEFGIAIAGVRNIGDFGRAGYYAEAAARHGCIALVCQNAPPVVGAPGSRTATHGTNPLAFTAPTDAAPLFDGAFTPRSASELGRRKLLGLSLPVEWGYVDAEGVAITDPGVALQSVMPVAGGPKGFGMVLLVDLLAGILTGSASGPDVPYGRPGAGAAVIALDPELFGVARDELESKLETARGAVLAGGGRWPGDRVRSSRERNVARGFIEAPIVVFEAVRDATLEVSRDLDLSSTVLG